MLNCPISKEGGLARKDIIMLSQKELRRLHVVMTADSNNLKPGMLLGKALQPLAKGQQGEVLTLITLQ